MLYFRIFLFSFILFFSGSAADAQKVAELSSVSANDVKLIDDVFAEYPDLCFDRTGNLWVAWMQNGEAGEQILLRKTANGDSAAQFVVSTNNGMEYRPRLACDNANRLWVVWAAKRNNNWDIYARWVQTDELSAEIRLTEHPAVDIHPAVRSAPDGSVWVVWESLRNGNFDIYSVQLIEGKTKNPIPVSENQYNDFRPALAAAGNGEVWIAWDRQVRDSYRVLLRRINGGDNQEERVVSPRAGFNQAPTLVVSKTDELVVAWQSDLRPDGDVGLSPWIYLKKFAQNRQTAFVTLADEGDWSKSGEDQGFEFPALQFDDNGRLWVFGRPSQGFFAQATDFLQKSDLYRFAVKGWGGRGQYVQTAVSPDGKLITVRRDIRAIYLTEIDPNRPEFDLQTPLKAVSFSAAVSKKGHHIKISDELKLTDGNRILFGDLHQHSWLSDGMGTADAAYTRSRFVYDYDFSALTDHEWFVGNMITPSEWEWLKIVARQFYRPDSFFTFAAYEWTTPRLPKGFGHKNVYFSGWDRPVFSFKNIAATTPDLFELLKKNGAIAVPHHIGWTGVDWDNHDETAQPDVEIVSAHGAFEYMGNEPITHRGGMPGNFVQDGLAKGLKFGLLGSSDGHGLRRHHGISRKEDAWQTGLTAVIVQDNSREAIFNALQQRRVYATSGVPIQIDFRINGHWMGEEITLSGQPEIEITVIGTHTLHYAILLRDNKEILHLGRDRYEGRGVKSTFIDKEVTPGRHWYYLRVLQEDGEMAWSSPVWVGIAPQ